MAKFCRIIELENKEQVLLVKDDNGENDSYDLKISVNLDDVTITATLGFGEKEDKRDKTFTEYSEKSALAFYKKMVEMTQE